MLRRAGARLDQLDIASLPSRVRRGQHHADAKLRRLLGARVRWAARQQRDVPGRCAARLVTMDHYAVLGGLRRRHADAHAHVPWLLRGL